MPNPGLVAFRLVAPVLAVSVLSASAAPAADLPEIHVKGTLKVIAASEEDPKMFSFAARGEPGFEREIVEGFARLQGLKVEAVPAATTADRIPMLARGAGDLIIGIVVTAERRKLVSFTSEVLPARHLVVSYKPGPVLGTIEAFKAAKIGLVKGTSWAQVALEAGVPAASVEYFPERHGALSALRDGKITATVMSVPDFTLSTKRYPGLQAGVFIGPATSAAFAVRKADGKLLAALNEYLENLRKGPSWNRLVVKYFGEQALAVLGRR